MFDCWYVLLVEKKLLLFCFILQCNFFFVSVQPSINWMSSTSNFHRFCIYCTLTYNLQVISRVYVCIWLIVSFCCCCYLFRVGFCFHCSFKCLHIIVTVRIFLRKCLTAVISYLGCSQISCNSKQFYFIRFLLVLLISLQKKKKKTDVCVSVCCRFFECMIHQF